jgi:glycosyltransferase involved in cell wall biosynthesis
MYPSKKNPTFGTFIRNIEEGLINNHDCIVDKVIINRNNLKPVRKLFVYIHFSLKCIYTILTQRHDIVYVHFVSHSYIPLLFLPKVLIRKLVINFHGTDFFSKKKILQKIIIRAIRKSDLVVVPSKYFKLLVSERFNKKEEDIFISPSGGVPEHFFKMHELSNKNEFTLGFVGRVIEEKGWKLFIKAIIELKHNNYNVQGIIVGPGDSIIINEYIKKMGISNQVKYLGPISHQKLPETYRKLDLFIFPTLFDESLGLVPIEAMANSVPSICSNFEAANSYIQDGNNGFLFEKGNTKELTNKVINYINLNQEEKNNLRNAAYKKALEFSTINISKSLYVKFKKILN